MNKIKGNQTVNKIAEEISEVVYSFIIKEQHRNHIFDFFVTEQGLLFGVALQKICYKHIGEFTNQKNRQVILKYFFSSCNLPDIKKDEDLEIFSLAVAQLVQGELLEKNLEVSIKQTPCVAYSDGQETKAFGQFSAIVYTHPQVQGEW